MRCSSSAVELRKNNTPNPDKHAAKQPIRGGTNLNNPKMKKIRSQLKKKIHVLIACEESQAETIAFRQLGIKAYSCDIQPCKKGGHPEWHICGDVTPYLSGQTEFFVQSGKKVSVPDWDLIIAHPPCTYLCRLSAKHIFSDKADKKVYIDREIYWVESERYRKLRQARKFFFKCLNAQAKYVAVENPVPLKVACLPTPTTFACPSWFGCKYTKKTCYWLRNLPPLMPTIIHPHPKQLVRKSRGKYRSRTMPELAQEIAKQWSEYILDEMEKQTAPRN